MHTCTKIGSGAYSSIYSFSCNAAQTGAQLNAQPGSQPTNCEELALKMPSGTSSTVHTLIREGILLKSNCAMQLKGLALQSDKTLLGFVMTKGLLTIDKWLFLIYQKQTFFMRNKMPALLSFFYQVCEQLSYLHQHKLVHGDVKCKNIVLFGNGKAMLCDFGISTKFTKEPYMPKYADMVCYTSSHRPYELLKASHYEIGPECDMWALGASMYECLFGLLTRQDNLYKIREDIEEKVSKDIDTRIKQFTSLAELHFGHITGDGWASCLSLIAKCLDYDPNARPTATQAAFALHKFAEVHHELYLTDTTLRKELPTVVHIGFDYVPNHTCTICLRPNSVLKQSIKDTCASVQKSILVFAQMQDFYKFKEMSLDLCSIFWDHNVAHDFETRQLVVCVLACTIVSYLYLSSWQLPMWYVSKLANISKPSFQEVFDTALPIALKCSSWSAHWIPCKVSCSNLARPAVESALESKDK